MLPLEVYLLTFNCGREFVDPRTLGAHFFNAWPKDKGLPDIISVSLQEIAPLPEAFRGPSHVEPYIQQIAKAIDVAVTNHSSGQISQRDQSDYKLLRWHGAGLTAQAVFVKGEVIDRIRHVFTAEVGVGVWSMGNKGAAGVRIVLKQAESTDSEDTVLTFVAAHLYPHEGGCAKRNEDWKNIVENLVFESDTDDHRLTFPEYDEDDRNLRSSDAEPLLGRSSHDTRGTSQYATNMFAPANSYLFFAGDLNYRTSDKGPEDDAHLNYPQPNVDPSSPHHYTHLLAHDQLNRERKANRTLHNLSEMSIAFPPTYKYAQPKAQADLNTDSDEDEVWQFARHRWPSWCDRILFTREEDLQLHDYDCLPVQATSDHRPVALSVTIEGTRRKVNPIECPFKINPNYRADRNTAIVKEVVVGNAAFLVLTNKGRVMVASVLAAVVATVFVLRALY